MSSNCACDVQAPAVCRPQRKDPQLDRGPLKSSPLLGATMAITCVLRAEKKSLVLFRCLRLLHSCHSRRRRSVREALKSVALAGFGDLESSTEGADNPEERKHRLWLALLKGKREEP